LLKLTATLWVVEGSRRRVFMPVDVAVISFDIRWGRGDMQSRGDSSSIIVVGRGGRKGGLEGRRKGNKTTK